MELLQRVKALEVIRTFYLFPVVVVFAEENPKRTAGIQKDRLYVFPFHRDLHS
jgi:hypothetical protein